MYRAIIGRFYEDLLIEMFDLLRADEESNGKLPDLISKDGSFYVEVKASNGGGVIKKKQLARFSENVDSRRFYAFPYHSLTGVHNAYATEQELLSALDLSALYIFPFSVAEAHFYNSNLRRHPSNDYFVQMSGSKAKKIFQKDQKEWKRLGLDKHNYSTSDLSDRVHLMTRGRNLEKKIKNSFNADVLEKIK